MPIEQVIVYAIIQGLTEFLPVSSTAHLVLVPWLMHWQDPGLTFDVALHLGTLIALLAFYWRDWTDILGTAFGLRRAVFDHDYAERRTLLWWMVIATIPAALAGGLFEKYFEHEVRQYYIIAGSLIGVALVMYFAERWAAQQKKIHAMTFGDTIFIGCFQAVALIPGVSRSGITITAGLFRGLTRGAAARFSFLLSTPIIAGAAAKKALEVHHTGIPPEMRMPFAVGIVVAAVAGWITLRFLTSFYEKHSLNAFMVYRIGLGVLILVIGLMR
ncbi:MAG: undecaprenyl-diphosphate phosphatase [Acidobacteriia bacterium]|nr:undecaprenyl-diphosphate phosphatase [Terriglobia bacterium]